MDDLLKEIHSDVKAIREEQVKLIVQAGVHNHILAQHENRSTMLEARVKPLEDDLSFRRKLYMLVMGGSGLIAILGLLIALKK